MERTKRIPISRTVSAVVGALAILALVAGPSLAHAANRGQSRIYEPAAPWTTQATGSGVVADSAGDDEKDADELRAEEDPTAEDADEQEADQAADAQG